MDGINVLKLRNTLSDHFKMPICHMTKQECLLTMNVERLFGATRAVKGERV